LLPIVLLSALALVKLGYYVVQPGHPYAGLSSRDTWPELTELLSKTSAPILVNQPELFIEYQFYHPEPRLYYVCVDQVANLDLLMRKLKPWQSNIVERAELASLGRCLVPRFGLIAGSEDRLPKSRTPAFIRPAGKPPGHRHEGSRRI